MATKFYVNPNYNWYSEELHPDVKTQAQKKGVIGWTGEHNLYQGTPTGKVIYPGFENNPHLNSPDDHRRAATSLHNRAKRIQQALASRRIPEQEMPAVQKELADIENQRDQHVKASVPAVVNPAMVTAKTEPRPMSSLLKSLRAKRMSGM